MKNNRTRYTGNILGFESSSGSIYNVSLDDTKCYIWRASVSAEIDIEKIKIAFNWNGDIYEITADIIKENYFSGKIMCNQVFSGSVFLWKYSNQKGVLLKGNYKEDERNFDCFIDLQKQNEQ
jgi:hypothetical protein